MRKCMKRFHIIVENTTEMKEKESKDEIKLMSVESFWMCSWISSYSTLLVHLN